MRTGTPGVQQVDGIGQGGQAQQEIHPEHRVQLEKPGQKQRDSTIGRQGHARLQGFFLSVGIRHPVNQPPDYEYRDKNRKEQGQH